MTSKNIENKKKVQSKLSFLDKFRYKTPTKDTEKPKDNIETKDTESQKVTDDKISTLFDKTDTSTMEVDTTNINTTEAVASGSGTTANENKTDTDLIELPLSNTSWGDTPMEDILQKTSGNLDDEAISPEFLKDAQQELQKNQSNSAATDKGKSKETADESTNEEAFIRVPKITRFFATVDEDKLPGKDAKERMVKLEHLLAASDGFLGVKHFRNRKQISIYFATEYDLDKAINTNKSALPDATFNRINSKEIRSAEADHTVHVRDIPLYAKSETIKNFFAKFGKIVRFSMTTVGPWQQAFIVYEKGTSLDRLNVNIWSVDIMDFSCRTALMTLPKDARDEREAFVMKLTGLPRGTTHLDLKDIIKETNARTCFIPRSRTTYKNLNYAFVAFENDDDALKAFEKIFKIKSNRLYWTIPGQQHCYVCGDPTHKTNGCTNRRTPNASKAQFNNLYERYKPAQYRTRVPPPRDQTFNYQNDNGRNS